MHTKPQHICELLPNKSLALIVDDCFKMNDNSKASSSEQKTPKKLRLCILWQLSKIIQRLVIMLMCWSGRQEVLLPDLVQLSLSCIW